jgi:hypothetical protein
MASNSSDFPKMNETRGEKKVKTFSLSLLCAFYHFHFVHWLRAARQLGIEHKTLMAADPATF